MMVLMNEWFDEYHWKGEHNWQIFNSYEWQIITEKKYYIVYLCGSDIKQRC